jgi:hypothetical protein
MLLISKTARILANHRRKNVETPRTGLVLVLRLGKRARRSVALVGAAPAGLVPLCNRGTLGRIRFLGFALELKQGLRVAGRSVARPNPCVAA